MDALEVLFVREMMCTNVVALPGSATLQEARELIRPSRRPHGQNLYPVLDSDSLLLGVISRNDLLKRFEQADPAAFSGCLRDIVSQNIIAAYPDEPLKVMVYRMVESGFTRLPVVDPEEKHRLLGMVSLDDLLRARRRSFEEERTRERALRFRLPRLRHPAVRPL